MLIYRRLIVGLAVLLAGTPLLVHAQGGKKAVLAGLVKDSTGKGVPDATVTVVDPRTGSEFPSVRTIFNGRFSVPGLEPGVPYTVRIAKLEYYPVIANNVVIPPTNVLRTEYTLVPNTAQQLERVVVRPPPKGSKLARKTLDSTEIAQAKVHSALDAIERLRPIMLAPNYDICITNDSLSLYVDGIRRPVYNPVEDPWGQQRQVMQQGRNRGMVTTTGRTNEEIVRDELSQIPADEIGEIIFVSCDDYNPKVLKRNAIWLLTKRYKANQAKYGLDK